MSSCPASILLTPVVKDIRPHVAAGKHTGHTACKPSVTKEVVCYADSLEG